MLDIKNRKQVTAGPRIKWLKLKKEERCPGFWEKLRQAMGGREKLADYRGTAKKVYPLDRGKRTRTPGCEIKKYRKRPKKPKKI